MALAEALHRMSPDEFAERCYRFVTTGVNPLVGSTFAESVYQPMLELLEALRAHGFATFIVTGGGTEFVRAVSEELYAPRPSALVGTMIGYEYVNDDGTPALVRTAESCRGSERGCGEGRQHPPAARPTARAGRRQLARRPRDDRLGGHGERPHAGVTGRPR